MCSLLLPNVNVEERYLSYFPSIFKDISDVDIASKKVTEIGNLYFPFKNEY